MGCGFSSPSSADAAAAQQHQHQQHAGAGAYRVPAVVSTHVTGPDANTTTPIATRAGLDDNADSSHLPGYLCHCGEGAHASVLSLSAMSALECRPSKRAHRASCWIRQWVQEAHHVIEPHEDNDAAVPDDDDEDASTASISAVLPAEVVAAADDDNGAVTRLSRAAVIEHNLRLAASGGDDQPTW